MVVIIPRAAFRGPNASVASLAMSSPIPATPRMVLTKPLFVPNGHQHEPKPQLPRHAPLAASDGWPSPPSVSAAFSSDVKRHRYLHEVRPRSGGLKTLTRVVISVLSVTNDTTRSRGFWPKRLSIFTFIVLRYNPRIPIGLPILRHCQMRPIYIDITIKLAPLTSRADTQLCSKAKWSDRGIGDNSREDSGLGRLERFLFVEQGTHLRLGTGGTKVVDPQNQTPPFCSPIWDRGSAGKPLFCIPTRANPQIDRIVECPGPRVGS